MMRLLVELRRLAKHMLTIAYVCLSGRFCLSQCPQEKQAKLREVTRSARAKLSAAQEILAAAQANLATADEAQKAAAGRLTEARNAAKALRTDKAPVFKQGAVASKTVDAARARVAEAVRRMLSAALFFHQLVCCHYVRCCKCVRPPHIPPPNAA